MEEPKKTIFAKLIAAQADFAGIAKTKQAQAFGRGRGYSYADINDVLEAVRPICNAHGFCIMQDVWNEEVGSVKIQTHLYSDSGESLDSSIFTVTTQGLQQQGIQALGSAITYAKRYQLVAFLGIALGDRDDDGQDSVKHDRSQAPKQEHPLIAALRAAQTLDELAEIGERIKEAGLAPALQNIARTVYSNRKAELTA